MIASLALLTVKVSHTLMPSWVNICFKVSLKLLMKILNQRLFNKGVPSLNENDREFAHKNKLQFNEILKDGVLQNSEDVISTSD